MEFKRKVSTLIEERVSTRTYVNKEMDIDIKGQVERILLDSEEHAKVIPDLKARFVLTTRDQMKSEKVGTYGVIYGANTYIVGIVDKKKKNPAAFGELFETIILRLTDLNLQTCWLGGTFKKTDFEKNINLDENEEIAIISPVGYGKDKARIFETAMRKLIKADQRKSWEMLFFEGDFNTSLTHKNAGIYEKPLEMVRLAPSASNKQPWRVLKIDENFHFYLKRTPGYGVTGFDMQLNDIGIAKCHFNLTLKELGVDGKWCVDNPNVATDNLEYVYTWCKKIDKEMSL